MRMIVDTFNVDNKCIARSFEVLYEYPLGSHFQIVRAFDYIVLCRVLEHFPHSLNGTSPANTCDEALSSEEHILYH